MATIVEYDARKKPLNAYPKHIVSPPHWATCCTTRMERVGQVQQDERCHFFYYRRCQVCGFTLRHFLPVEPPEHVVAIGRQAQRLGAKGHAA